ncbi:MAG: SRPBCC family protein [Planctomycetota bacterium]
MSQPLDPALRARLARGEVVVRTEPVPGSQTPRLVMQAVIDAPPARAWAVIDDAGRYKEFMPRVKHSEVLLREGERVRTRMTVAMPFPLKDLSAVTEGVHHVEPDQLYTRSWRLGPEPSDYHRNDGSWTLTPFEGDPGRSLAVYTLHVEPRIRIPKKLAAVAQEKAMPQVMDAIRQRVRMLG